MRFSRSLVVAAIASALTFGLAAMPAAAGDIDSVSFRDATNGYISGGYAPDSWTRVGFASVTHDGGATWEAATVPGTRLRGVAATPAGALAVSDYFARVLSFLDASGEWTPLGSGDVASNASFFDAERLSSGRLVAVGMRESNRGEPALIAVSSDGGSTWTRGANGEPGFEGPFYAAPNPYEDPPSTYASMAAVDESPDGTTAWVLGNEWQPSDGSTGSSGSYKRRLVFRSADGGQTWVQQTVPVLTGHQPVNALTVVDANTAFGFGTTRQFIKTTNAGVTWAQSLLPATTLAPAVTMLGADSRGNRIVAVGLYGLTARSLDGGVTWTYTRVTGAGTLRGVAMLTDTEWIAVGANETILRTTDAGATWTGQKTNTAPVVAITAPAASFGINALPVAIGGTATDGAGVGVAKVEFRVKRSDGLSYDGAAWVPGDAWLPAQTSDGWATWSGSWTPDAQTLASGLMVTITARATDGAGTAGESAGVSSGIPFSAAVSVSGGAAYTTTTQVPVAISTGGSTPTQMRWKVDSGAFGGWGSYQTTATVMLPAGDGPKTVTFEFSNAGGTLGTAADTITLHTGVPAVSMTSPAPGGVLSASPITISGTSTDPGAGVSAVHVLIRRSDGRSWNGSAWVSGDFWLPASTSDAYANWSRSWTPDADVLDPAKQQTVTIIARATDVAGLTGLSGGVDLFAPGLATVSLNGGAATTTSTNVTATVSAPGYVTHMHWRVDGGDFTTWQGMSNPVAITLTPGDGTKSVDFEFSADGGASVVATASDTIALVTPVPDPTVSVSSPSPGFALVEGTTWITGIAADDFAVDSVHVRIRRADGQSWNGSAWTSADEWLLATTADGWANWMLPWSPTLAGLGSGGIVTVTARATSARGTTALSTPVSSAAPVTGSVTLRGGAAYTRTTTVAADVSATGATHMRWRVGAGSPNAWQPYAATAAVTLPSGDGVKSVTFEFSPNGSGVGATAADSIVLDATKPSVAFTSAALYFSKAANSLKPAGTSADVLSGLVSTRMTIVRNGLYWDSLTRTWTPDESFLPLSGATPAAWSYTWALDAATAEGTLPATVTVTSEDAAGNVSQVQTVARPKSKVYAYAPSTYWLPGTVTRGRYYYAIGYLKPQHTLNTHAATIQAYRYERRSNGTYGWVLRRSYSAAGYTAQRYRARIALPYAGTWLVRVYHPEDATHLSALSASRRITVR